MMGILWIAVGILFAMVLFLAWLSGTQHLRSNGHEEWLAAVGHRQEGQDAQITDLVGDVQTAYSLITDTRAELHKFIAGSTVGMAAEHQAWADTAKALIDRAERFESKVNCRDFKAGERYEATAKILESMESRLDKLETRRSQKKKVPNAT
jgi:hypothetical protein